MTAPDVDPSTAAEAVRRDVVDLLDELATLDAEIALPAPDPADLLTRLRERLVADTYQVLVAGEAKRGKSSLVNALVGVDVLPTDVAVATSQVFRVRGAARAAYRLRFEDDTTREISREDLARYGSQVLDDAGERPRLDQVLRWIEVDLPGARFLPDGVRLLDTPGLGALYAAHQQITQRLVPLADATVFVLDSERPIMRTELDFVGQILAVSTDVLFVQTKIDLFGRDQVESIRERNEELLREHFPVLDEVRVWPISSRFLLAAADRDADPDDAEENLDDSGYPPVEAAVRAFLFRVAGWRRAADALVAAEVHQAANRRVLAARLAGATEESEDEQERRQERLRAWRADFDAEWGPRGHRYLRLVDDVTTATQDAVAQMRQLLSPYGRLAAMHRDAVDAAGAMGDLRDLNERLPAELTAAAQEALRRTSQRTEERLSEIVGPFFADAAAPGWTEAPDLALQLRSRAVRGGRGALWEHAVSAGEGLLTSASIGAAVLTVFTGGVAAVAVIGGVLWATVHSWRRSSHEHTEVVREEVRRNVDRLLEILYAQMLGTDSPDRAVAPVEEHFLELRRAAVGLVASTVERKQEEARAEHDRLLADARLDDQRRRERIAELQDQLARWDATGAAIDRLGDRLAALRTSAEAAAAGARGAR